MQNANDYTKLSFYNEIELVHIFISDFHAFEKKIVLQPRTCYKEV